MKLFKFLVTFSAGAFLGLLFAQRAGKEFRKDLKNSNDPLKTVLRECKSVHTDIAGTVTQSVKECEAIQQMLEKGQAQMDQIVYQAQSMSEEGKKAIQKKLEELSQAAQNAVEELKEVVGEKKEEIGKRSVRTIAKKS
jgi:gas vesicle protein